MIVLCANLIDWIKEHLLTCPSKYFFHMDCPGCGMQRSIVALLEGDIWDSLKVYPATIPIFSLLIFSALHIKFNFRSGAIIIRWMYIVCSIIVLIFYLYKVFTHKIF